MTLPIEPALLETRLSTQELIVRIHKKLNELEMMVYALEARVDGAFPGADLPKHRQDHEDIHEAQKDRHDMMRSLRDKTLAGVLMALGALGVIGIVVMIRDWIER